MILVTGASGFIGRHVVEALLLRFGGKVRVFDVRPWIRSDSRIESFTGGIQEPSIVASAVEGVDVIVHLAAKVQPDSDDSSALFRTNVEGAVNVYSAALRTGSKLFVHLSSAGVYGPPRAPEPFTEADACEPKTPYQRSKWKAEEALQAAPAKTTLNILRPAGVYGPGSLLEIPAYKRILRQKWAIELRGGISVHPTHVSDVVGGILAIIENPSSHGSVFNIGGERPILLQELEDLIAATLQVPRRRVVLPSGVAGPLARVAQPLLSSMGRPNDLLVAMTNGKIFSAAVNDRAFRNRYPLVPVMNLRNGIEQYASWAVSEGLLSRGQR
jgi:2-alkyl-3-oxoalkanoate reductase